MEGVFERAERVCVPFDWHIPHGLYVYAHIGAVEEVVELEFVDVALVVTAHDRFTSGFPEQFEGDCARTPRV